jgi:hypothetical protein
MNRSQKNHVIEAPAEHEAEVTQQEIEAALDLSAQREFSKSLALFQEMLPRAKDTQAQMTILFGIVTSSTWLNLDQIKENAVRQLKQLPDYEVSHAFVAVTQASALVDFGRRRKHLI